MAKKASFDIVLLFENFELSAALALYSVKGIRALTTIGRPKWNSVAKVNLAYGKL
jgi:hypothetical protein